MEGNWNGALGQNKYQYNGKEWNDDFGLGWNDYGARFYDPAMSRWVAIDPLAEKYVKYSPYNYVGSNPVNLIDPNGMQWADPKSASIGNDLIEDLKRLINEAQKSINDDQKTIERLEKKNAKKGLQNCVNPE